LLVTLYRSAVADAAHFTRGMNHIREAFERVYTKKAQNQNGPDQNGPQLLELLLLAAACALYDVH